MMRYVYLIVTYLFLLAFNPLYAQPSAILDIEGETSFCESGEVTLKIKFTGVGPFGYALQNVNTGAIELPNDKNPIFIDPESDGWYRVKKIVKGSATFSLIRVWDSTTLPWVYPTTGVGVVGQTVDVHVDAMPAPAIGTYPLVCGPSVTLNATPDKVSTTFWWSADGGTFSDATLANPLFTTPDNAEGVFVLNFTQKNGSCQATQSVGVDFRSTPTASLSGSQNICLAEGGSFTMDATVTIAGHEPFRYTLSDGAGNNYSAADCPLGATVSKVKASANNQVYTLTQVVDVNNCKAVASGMTGSAKVTDLNPVVNAGADDMVCGKTIALNASTDRGVGSWSVVNDGVGVAITDVSNAFSTITASKYGRAELKWSAVNEGCVNSDNVKIHFAVPADVQLVDDKATICEGEQVEMKLNLIGASPWMVEYMDGATLKTEPFTVASGSVELKPQASMVYPVVKVTSGDGCVTSVDLPFDVTVEPLEPANAGADQVFDRVYETSLSALPEGLAGYWTVNNSVVQLSDVNNRDVNVSKLIVGQNVFRWTTLSTACPSTSDEVVVEVKNYTNYNGFSPNGDGVNDYFVIDGGVELMNSVLTVFDQRGKEMFRTVDYRNDWQGNAEDGSPLPDGVYYYVFQAEGRSAVRDYVIIRRKTNNTSGQ